MGFEAGLGLEFRDLEHFKGGFNNQIALDYFQLIQLRASFSDGR